MSSLAAHSTAISSKADELLEKHHKKLFALGLDVTFNRSTLATKYWLSPTTSDQHILWTISEEDEKQLVLAFTQCEEHLEQFEEAVQLESSSRLSQAAGAFAQDVRKISRMIDACRDSSGSESSQGGSQKQETRTSEPRSQFEAQIPPPGTIDNNVALGKRPAARKKIMKEAVTVPTSDHTDSQANTLSPLHETSISPLAQSKGGEYFQSFFDTNISVSRHKESPLGTKQPAKDKRAVPIIPSFEGYVCTVLGPTRPGQPVSWIRTCRTQMPLSSQELYDKAMAHMKQTGLGLSSQFQSLGPNQQSLVVRLVDEKNIAEKDPNAVWKLFGVRKLYEEHRSTFKTLRINNAIRITIRRGERAGNLMQELRIRGAPQAEVDQVDIPQSSKEVADKDEKASIADMAAAYQDLPQHGGIFYRDDSAHDVGHDPLHQDTRPQDQRVWTRQAPPDPFRTHSMSDALPTDPSPLPPSYHHQQGYSPGPPPPPQQTSFPWEYSYESDTRHLARPQQQLEPFDQQIRGNVSHASAAQSPRPYPREMLDSEQKRIEDSRRLTDLVRDEVRNALRDATAANAGIHRWLTTTATIPSTSSDHQSYAAASSTGRRYSLSSRGTSPGRSEQELPDHQPRSRDSSGVRLCLDDQDRGDDPVIRPLDTHGHHERWTSAQQRSPLQIEGPFVEQRERPRRRHSAAQEAPQHTDSIQPDHSVTASRRDRPHNFDGYPAAGQRPPLREDTHDRHSWRRRSIDYEEDDYVNVQPWTDQ